MRYSRIPRSDGALDAPRQEMMVAPYTIRFAHSEPGPKPRVGILPVPYDRTASYQAGARNGPDAILRASTQLEQYDEVLGTDPGQAGLLVLEPLEPHADGPGPMIEEVRAAVGEILDREMLPVVLGGDHSVTIGSFTAIADRVSDLSVLQFDAHADMRDEFEGSRRSHGVVMRRVRDRCHAVSLGIRSVSESESLLVADLPIHGPRAVRDATDPSELLSSLSPSVYLTIDVDAFDPSIVPATGTPEPGGLSWEDVDRVLDWVGRNRRIVGLDVVELMPIPGLIAPEYLAARLVYRTIGRALRSRGELP